MKLPTLYKRTNTGKIQQWDISVEDKMDCSVIYTVHGQVGGKLQETSDAISEGKNLGKANATTYQEQARAEAKARWTKQKKKGYVESIEAAQSGETDELIEGGVLPMLAPNKSWPKDKDLEKAIIFPCAAQPKLDGMRCIAIIENGKCTLWSRTRKEMKSVPHINRHLEHCFFDKGLPFKKDLKIVLDGELYNHDYKDSFEDLLSILRQEEPDSEGVYLNAQYHLYDILEQNILEKHTNLNNSFKERNSALNCLFIGGAPVKFVPTEICTSFHNLVQFFEKCEDEGYEGAMARNLGGPYESGKRSKHLQKMKRFIDQEFKIIGMEDGRGKDAGTIAKFICLTKDGNEFKPRLKATYDHRRKLFNGPESAWKNKMLTVRFKRWTNGNVPYIPVGTAIGDDK